MRSWVCNCHVYIFFNGYFFYHIFIKQKYGMLLLSFYFDRWVKINKSKIQNQNYKITIKGGQPRKTSNK